MIKRNRISTSYINNSLNRSSSKETHKFPKAERFIPQKKFSPDRFYDIPDTLEKRSAGIGYGKKVDLVLNQINDPARYVLRSQFEEIAQGYRFGVRPSLVPGLNKDYSQQKRRQSSESSPKKYSNGKMTTSKSKGPSPNKQTPSTTAKNQKRRIQINQENSFIHQRKSAKRLKYEYSQQCLLNNNRTSYTQFLNPKRNQKDTHHVSTMGLDSRKYSPFAEKSSKCLHQHSTSTFGREERMRQKQMIPRDVGPGSYNVFSEFGDNLRQF